MNLPGQSNSEVIFRINSIDAESGDHYNKKLLECNREIMVNSKKKISECQKINLPFTVISLIINNFQIIVL